MTTIPAGLQLTTAKGESTAEATLAATTTTAANFGPTVSITPKKASSKIRISWSFDLSALNAGGRIIYATLLNGSSPVIQGDAAGSRQRVTQSLTILGAANMGNLSGSYIVDAVDTSARTYQLAFSVNVADTIYLNRSATDTNNAAFPRGASWIIAEEIST